MSEPKTLAPLSPEQSAAPSHNIGSNELFAALEHRFEQTALQSGGVRTQHYEISGRKVAVRFAGDTLVPPLTPALAHLRGEGDGHPELTIAVWSDPSGKRSAPEMIGGHGDYSASGGVQCFRGDGYFCALRHRDHEALFYAPDADRIPPYEIGSPFKILFNWWMKKNGGRLVHGGVVGTSRGGVLLSGKGGSGKSTVALACLEAGFDYIGDDYVLIEDDAPLAHSLYSSAKLHGDHLRKHQKFLPVFDDRHLAGQGKQILFLDERYSRQLKTRMPLRAIVLPKVGHHADTRVAPVSPAAALASLAPSTLFQLPGSGQLDLQIMARLVGGLPAHSLEIGNDLSRVPAALTGLLAAT